MGATHSRKKSSSKNIREEHGDLREEEQGEGRRRFSFFRKNRFRERCVEIEDNATNAANDSDYNIVKDEVKNHNFLEYKLRSIKKKYESKNENSTEEITEKSYPEHFNPFAIEPEYSSILNPFDEDDDDDDDNSLENVENIANNSEIHSIESFNHKDKVGDEETCERINVNLTPEKPLMATYEINNSGAEDKMEDKEKCESIKVNSTSGSPLMAKYEDNNKSEVNAFDKNKDDFIDFYNSESNTANINISEKEAHSVLENEKQPEMIIKDENFTEIITNKEEISCNTTTVSDTTSYSEIKKFNQNETTENSLKTTSSDTDKISLKNSRSIVSSVEQVSSIQALEAIDNFISINLSPNFASKIEDNKTPENIRNNLNPENPLITIDVKKSDPKIDAIEIDYDEKLNPFCEFQNPVNETATINKNLTPKNINSCNVPPAIKRKSFKKYKAPAPPVFATLPEKENLSRLHGSREEKEIAKELSKDTPTRLQQEELKNTYRISRPAPAPPVSESLKPVRATANRAPKSMKIVPTNECGRKVRRKSILDLFKVKKKKKKMMDM